MPNTREPLLETILNSSARVGELLIPAGSLEAFLGRYVSSLMFWNHDETHKVSVVGSATSILHSGRHLLLCSNHQLSGRDLEDLGLMLPNGSMFVTSSGSRTFSKRELLQVSDAYDVAAFDFSQPVREHPSLAPQFFRFSEVPPDAPNVAIIAFIVVGFPSADQKYELEERNHLGMVKRIVVAKPDGQPTDVGTLRLKYLKELDFEPDGLSGGPAFVVQMVDQVPKAYLGGMVVRSNREFCHIVKCGYLWQFISGFD